MKLYNDSREFFADKVLWILSIIVIVILLFSLPAQIAVRYGYIDVRYEKLIYFIFGNNPKDACTGFIVAVLDIIFTVELRNYWLKKWRKLYQYQSQMFNDESYRFVCELVERNEKLTRANMELANKLVKTEKRWLEKILVKSDSEKVYCLECRYYSSDNDDLKCAVHPDLQANCKDFETWLEENVIDR